MRITFLNPALLVSTAISMSFALTAHARVVEKIVAVVGDEVVLQSEVDERAAPFLTELAAVPNAQQRATRSQSLRREVLDRMIDEVLLVQQATEFKLSVTSEEVDKLVDQVKRDYNMTDVQLAAELRRAGLAMSQYRQNMRREILKSRVLDIAVRSKVNVNETDLQGYYTRHLRSGANLEVRVSHIFVAIPDGADAAAVLEREQVAKKLADRAQNGEDFAKLARENSEDRATRAEGGDMGFFGREMGLPKPVEELVFTMKKGDIRGPVRIEKGFSVLKVVESRSKDNKPFSEVREQLRRQLYQKEYERQSKIYLGDLRKKALVDLRL